MSIIEDIQRNSPNIKNRSLILKAFGEELFEKSRTGVYSNNAQNRRLKRVGQKYGSKKEEQQGPDRKLKEKDKEKEKPQKSLDEHARATSQQALETAIKSHKDPEVRKAAHKELERRKKEEYPQEEKKDDKKVEEKKELSHEEKIGKRIEDLSDKYKSKLQELMKDENVGNDEVQSKLSKESQEISRYINRCSQFKNVDIKEESKKVTDLLGLKDEKEIKDFFGDGEILGVKVEDNTISILSNDCYLERTFDKPAVHMDEFILNPDVDKSQGKGTEIFYNQVQSFKKLGFKELNTDAAKSSLYNGYYTWARLGYDFNNNEGKDQFKKILKLYADKELEKVQSLPELMTTEKGRKFWKENGFSFFGTFRLNDDSESMFMLEEYIKEKKNGKEKK